MDAKRTVKDERHEIEQQLMRDSISKHLNRTFKATEAIAAMNKVCDEVEYQLREGFQFELINKSTIGILRDGAQVLSEFVANECSEKARQYRFLMPPY